MKIKKITGVWSEWTICFSILEVGIQWLGVTTVDNFPVYRSNRFKLLPTFNFENPTFVPFKFHRWVDYNKKKIMATGIESRSSKRYDGFICCIAQNVLPKTEPTTIWSGAQCKYETVVTSRHQFPKRLLEVSQTRHPSNFKTFNLF